MKGPWGPGLTEVEPIRVNIGWRYLTSEMQTGFYLRRQTAAAASYEDIAEHVEAALLAPFRALLTVLDVVTKIDVVNIVEKQGYTLRPQNVTGTQNGNLAPTFLMVPISFRSEYRQRNGHGRGFWPIRDEAQTTADDLSAPGKAAVDAMVDALVDSYVDVLGTAPFRMIAVQPFLPATRPTKKPTPLPEVPATWYDIETVQYLPRLSSLKSRKMGRGS